MATQPNPTALSVSVQDAADMTSLSTFLIRTAINKGDLKAKKVGTRIAIKVDDLAAWLDAQPDAAA